MGVPILMCHGRQDPIVPLALARKSFDTLDRAGLCPPLARLPHATPAVRRGEIIAISQWLLQVLPPI
ncbi:MAG: hypothetical protein WDM77_15050 [Steroidobacteraceae bacterium]